MEIFHGFHSLEVMRMIRITMHSRINASAFELEKIFLTDFVILLMI